MAAELAEAMAATGVSAADLRLLVQALRREQREVSVREMAQAEIEARPAHRRYVTSLRRLIAWAGDRDASSIRPDEIESWARRAGDEARRHRQARHGVGAEQAFVQAVRAAYARVVEAGRLSDSPARRVRLPERPPSQRTALTSVQLRQVHLSAVGHSRDPMLDDLVFQFLRETACRRGGAASARRSDLSARLRLVRLVEKYGKQRWVPVSAHLIERLVAASPECGCGRLLHRSDGGHLTAKWFEGFGRRIQRLYWAAELGVSAHWVRHTTLTDIERLAGIRVAAAYAGHSDRVFGVTGVYTKPSIDELHLAHGTLFFDELDHAADPAVEPQLFRRALPAPARAVEFG